MFITLDRKYPFIKHLHISGFHSPGMCEQTVNTKVAFISRLFMVMGNPEVDYGYCSCKHSQNNIPSCLLCRVYTVHQCDDYCGDGGDQPVWPPAGTTDQAEGLDKALVINLSYSLGSCSSVLQWKVSSEHKRKQTRMINHTTIKIQHIHIS